MFAVEKILQESAGISKTADEHLATIKKLKQELDAEKEKELSIEKEKLPLENIFQDPIKGYINLAIALILEGEVEAVSELIMKTEYDHILKKYDCPL